VSEVAVCPTIGQAVAAAAEDLQYAGVSEPRREALVLWSAMAGFSPGDVWLLREQPAPDDLLARFREMVCRRATGEPTAYAAGTAAFRTLELLVDHRALIPRPETEGLVDRVLQWAAKGGQVGVVADIGTGTGCIALSLAVEGQFDRVVATDRSREALELARANLRRVAPRLPVTLLQGDLLEPLSCGSLDAIVSNPPYLTEAEFEALDSSVRQFEPAEALVGGEDGMKHTQALLETAGASLRPGGLLAIELDSGRAPGVLALSRAAGWIGARIERDLFGRSRFLLANKELS
jgi:release factor glutamine methyltransferase